MRALGIILLIFLTVACDRPDRDGGGEAKAAFEAYVAAINADDTKKAAAMYDGSPGFHWIERGGIQYESGIDAARSLTAMASDGGSSEMTVDTVRVAELANDAALVSGHFEYAKIGKNGEQEFAFDGWMTVGMVKREDGWKIAGGQTGPGGTRQEAFTAN